MKILPLGDIHGRTIWKAIIEKEQPDIVVFIGDYLDSINIGVWEQITNMYKIFEYAEEHGNVHLLLGNHDFHYMSYCLDEQYSGFKPATVVHVRKMLDEMFDKGTLKTVHRIGDLLFSHAGVTKTWMTRHGLGSIDAINPYVAENPHSLRFIGTDWYGDDVRSSPIWVRPRSLKQDRLDGFVQIVGHTALGGIVDEQGVFFIDALEEEKYLIIEDGVFTKNQL